jgi:hypothetical protein
LGGFLIILRRYFFFDWLLAENKSLCERRDQTDQTVTPPQIRFRILVLAVFLRGLRFRPQPEAPPSRQGDSRRRARLTEARALAAEGQLCAGR